MEDAMVDDEQMGERFEEFVERITDALGRADRREPAELYLKALQLPIDRKNHEVMAAAVRPEETSKTHQSLNHLATNSEWSDQRVLKAAREYAFEKLGPMGQVEAWIVDQTGLPKKGEKSVGVARQYCGELGKIANCQIGVSLSAMTRTGALPMAWRLYLPEQWAEDDHRRREAGVPEEVEFQTKWEIVLDQIDQLSDDVAAKPIVADAEFGDVPKFREQLRARDREYVLEVSKDTKVWPPGQEPLPPEEHDGPGRPPTRLRRTDDHQPVEVRELASELDEDDFEEVVWREGSQGPESSRFAALRCRPSARDYERTEPRPEHWLLIEWPAGADEPESYWLATLDKEVALSVLVYLAKLRWYIEQNYKHLKQELGLGDLQARKWRSFHHHGTLCFTAYAFLLAERGRLFPPRRGRIGSPGIERFMFDRLDSSPAAIRDRPGSRPTAASDA